jgi:hypothetical protein
VSTLTLHQRDFLIKNRRMQLSTMNTLAETNHCFILTLFRLWITCTWSHYLENLASKLSYQFEILAYLFSLQICRACPGGGQADLNWPWRKLLSWGFKARPWSHKKPTTPCLHVCMGRSRLKPCPSGSKAIGPRPANTTPPSPIALLTAFGRDIYLYLTACIICICLYLIVLSASVCIWLYFRLYVSYVIVRIAVRSYALVMPQEAQVMPRIERRVCMCM